MTYGLAGDADECRGIDEEEIEEKYPDDTLMNTIWIPTATAAWKPEETAMPLLRCWDPLLLISPV